MEALKYVQELAKRNADNFKKEKDGELTAVIPDFKSGDELSVAVRVVEGEKERIQNFRGIVIKKSGAGLNRTFTIRKISNGVGVERIFSAYSPMIQSIQLIKKGRVRRAKLFYLRAMSDKKIRAKLS